jgi:hypothetical protein
MPTSSDLAELSTLRNQLDDVVKRLVVVAERYDDTADSAIATDLFAAERFMISARRSIDRAVTGLTP